MSMNTTSPTSTYLYLASFICAQYFPLITNGFQKSTGHPGGAYLIFAVICASCALFTWRVVPETKGLTLEEIGHFWLKRTGKGT